MTAELSTAEMRNRVLAGQVNTPRSAPAARSAG